MNTLSDKEIMIYFILNLVLVTLSQRCACHPICEVRKIIKSHFVMKIKAKVLKL